MINILSSRYSFPSARLLKNTLTSLTEDRIKVTATPEKLKRVDIRFGNSFGNYKEDTKLNSPEFISFCSNKLIFSSLLLTNGFYTPIYRRDMDLIFPLLIRKTLSGSGGRGIILCKDKKEFDLNWNTDHWTEYINTQFELRVHVLDGEIVKIFKKEEEKSSEFPIRNNASCHFSLKDTENYPKLYSLIKTLNDLFTSKMGCGFYALDVGWDSKKKEYFIFEANSAPGLNENTANIYAEFLLKNLEVT
jgi:glutathione synthase/RimK-type ligase-like ATP-grasp enzyme